MYFETTRLIILIKCQLFWQLNAQKEILCDQHKKLKWNKKLKLNSQFIVLFEYHLLGNKFDC